MNFLQHQTPYGLCKRDMLCPQDKKKRLRIGFLFIQVSTMMPTKVFIFIKKFSIYRLKYDRN